MYAIIRSGGKQYRVAKDDILALERLKGEAGSKITLDEVLLLGENGKAPTIGTPLVSGAKVSAEILEQGRGDKINVIKFKRRKQYRRKIGHRQDITKVKILDIIGAEKKKASTGKTAEKKTTTKKTTKSTSKKTAKK